MSAMTPADDWRAWAPEALVGGAVLLVGLIEVAGLPLYLGDTAGRAAMVLLVLGVAFAVATSRRAPAVGLGLVWLLGAVQVVAGVPMLATEIALVAVAFGCARWGRIATVWFSGLSIPLAGLAAAAVAATSGLLRSLLEGTGHRGLLELATRFADTWQVGAVVIGVSLLAVPWLAGLALRFLDNARASRVGQVEAEADAARAIREREQAQEIARLREEQARLARDVHDVVGHSLAVILAQAESSQYLPEADRDALKDTMATIASSARRSLQDVRQVLSSSTVAVPRAGMIAELIEGVRAAGHDVVSTEVGAPMPLPPDLETVAYRVLQEMLTNALKHGRRDVPVEVERHWEGELRIEVTNAVASGEPADQETVPLAAAGRGVEGMRRRLESVGGRLDVRRRDGAGGSTYTATAWLPTGVAR